MSYSYYRERPGWGTQQFEFAPPPAPAFRPQPTWRGRDYYNAAAPIQDPSIYDSTWNRVSAATGGGLGVGFHEARHWHRRAYGGLADIMSLLPHELGAAAGYEAYRNWIHNSSVYEPLAPDDMIQREAIVGLAVAEATRLWQGTGRRMDRLGLQQACDAAGATASIIVGQWSENEPYRSPNPMTPMLSAMGSPMVGGSSIGGGSMMGAGSVIGGGSMMGAPTIASPVMGGAADPYAYDDDLYRRRHRRRRRHSTVIQSQPPPTIINVGGGAGPQPFPVQVGYSGVQPGVPLSSSPYPGAGVTYGASSVGTGAYGGYGAGSAVGVGGYPGGYGTTTAIPATGYGSSLGGFGVGAGLGASNMMGGMHLGGSVLNPLPPSMQASYQAQMAAQYPNAMPNIGGIVPGQGFGGPIVIPPPHRHHHRSRERSREPSRERDYERRRMRRNSDVGYGSMFGPPASAYGGRY